MPDISSEQLSQMLSGLLNNPDIANILSSDEKKTEGSPPDAGNISLPPDFTEKLPQVISMLSGMGFGKGDKPSEAQKVTAPVSHSSAGNRKELLRALRPYLSPHRQTVIDSLMSIEGLSGILDKFPVPSKKEDKQ